MNRIDRISTPGDKLGVVTRVARTSPGQHVQKAQKKGKGHRLSTRSSCERSARPAGSMRLAMSRVRYAQVRVSYPRLMEKDFAD